ncbi:putative phage tail length determination protein [Burkholderia aenigmatica]|uniref:Putative phage tail length determination protein n=3 Tax=Burkholderia TaxID=32008 RepID=A0A6J5IRG2_9BURK|nr:MULTISPECIES: phage tail tape measure protein [Burkholderia cepacia complex]AYQ40288.1 phage tail protein [Burkholderia lata]CAB3962906.1 putative phage tail length determination protein [Burkholderia aenigmatica]VWD13941.1 putative phage tail length determination protein [Burkholderia aenigmatica]
MSSMTLRYIINLTGDLKRRAAENARAVEQASKRQTTALTNTDKAAQKTEKSIEKIGAKTNASKVDADARKMQSGLNNVTTAANRTTGALGSVTAATQRADSALARLGSSSSLDRTFRYLGSVARRMNDIRRDADRMAAVLARAGQTAGTIAAGTAAGGAAAVATLKRPVEFDKRLADMVNVAYPERSLAGRVSGMQTLESAINRAVQQGGGSRDSAADALDKMIASGTVNINDAMTMLPDLQKAATAANADVTELAQIAIRGMQTFGLSVAEVRGALSKAVVAGQAGGFELRDMSKWLPKLMAASSGKLGMRGLPDFERILSYAQASVITAGSPDEGGNNFLNLLLKINSADTEKDFARAGINLPKSLARARERGFDPVSAFIDFGRQFVEKNPDYMKLRAKAATQTGEDKKATYRAMADILQGSAFGQVIQDREATMAMVAVMQNPDYIKDVLSKVRADSGQAVDSNFAVVSDRAGYKAQQVANEADMSRSRVFEQIDGPLKSVLTSATQLAQAFPAVTTALTGFGQAVGVATAAGAGGALAAFLLNRGRAGAPGAPGGGGLGGFGAGPVPVYVVNKVPGWTAPTPGGGAAGAAAGGAAAAGAGRGLMSRLGASAPWMITAGLAAYDLLPTLLDSSKTPTEKVNAAGRAAAGVAGGWAGAQAGAALGAFGGPFAPVTVPLGGAIGGAVGYLGATWAGDTLSRMNMLPSQRAGLLSSASGGQVQVPQDMQDRLSILRTTPAYMTNPLMQPTAGLDMLKRMQSEPQRVEIGNGLLGINISVHDDRVLTSTQVLQQPSALRLDPGATNPGGTN